MNYRIVLSAEALETLRRGFADSRFRSQIVADLADINDLISRRGVAGSGIQHEGLYFFRRFSVIVTVQPLESDPEAVKIVRIQIRHGRS